MFSEDQQYVIERAAELDVPLALVEHARQTSSCVDKADLLGWSLDRVVKAMYVSDGASMLGLIARASLGKLPVKKIVQEALGIGSRAAKRYRLSTPPQGMTYGTCTPFAHKGVVENGIGALVFVGAPSSELVDVSIGGTGERAHYRSAHLPYDGIEKILRAQFPEKVCRVPILQAA